MSVPEQGRQLIIRRKKTMTDFEEYKTKLIEEAPDPDGDGHTEE